jgi:hypothetical protein
MRQLVFCELCNEVALSSSLDRGAFEAALSSGKGRDAGLRTRVTIAANRSFIFLWLLVEFVSFRRPLKFSGRSASKLRRFRP